MTDVHCHLASGDGTVRELLVGRDFLGVHPWAADALDLAALRRVLAAKASAGVGEIGLDRLREREIPPAMRAAFESQLALAAELGRPVALHGAKCWGQVVRACARYAGRIPAFLFHGFSRSEGLLPDIARLNGFVSVGPAVLNDHAVNYRELVRRIPAELLVVETDRTAETAATCPSVREVLAKAAELRGVPAAELEAQTDANAARLLPLLP